LGFLLRVIKRILNAYFEKHEWKSETHSWSESNETELFFAAGTAKNKDKFIIIDHF